MKAIEDLYEYANDPLLGYASQECHKKELLDIIEELKAEIERDYMRLPVDADGEPIHVGDEMRQGNKLIGVVTGVGFSRTWVLQPGKCVSASFIASGIRHVKSDSLVELLKEYALDVAKSVDENIVGFSPCSYTLDQYTERFRELMKEVKE